VTGRCYVIPKLFASVASPPRCPTDAISPYTDARKWVSPRGILAVVNALKVGEDTDVEAISDIVLRRRRRNMASPGIPFRPSLRLRWLGSENGELLDVKERR
jgi:hypothetical protein